MISEKKLYDLDDITVIPSIHSSIRHRGEINPYYKVGNSEYLPIFVSPMECVIFQDNFRMYQDNKVIPILPRTEEFDVRTQFTNIGEWVAYGLEEFNRLFCEDGKCFANSKLKGSTIRALIDNANGHMDAISDAIRNAKALANKYGYTIEIMAGNIANPQTYKELAEAGADYVRCSIGTGACCITASNTSTYMPMASLLDECRKIKDAHKLKCAIVADGGISSYSRAIKALALGADYVMIGSTFGRCFESSSPFIRAELNDRDVIEGFGIENLNNMRFDRTVTEDVKKRLIGIYKPIKAVWGMSTRRAQLSIGLAQGKKREDIKLKTSEGIEKQVQVDYTLHQWTENFTDYLRSAMSYCDSRTLDDYIGHQMIYLMSDAAKNAINK